MNNELSNIDLANAVVALAKQVQNQSGNMIISPRKSSITFEEAYNMQIERRLTRGQQPGTIGTFNNSMKQFLSYLTDIRKDKNLELVTVQDINRYVIGLRSRQLAATTINQQITHVRSLFGSLISNKLLEIDPTVDLVLETIVKKFRRTLTDDEIKRVTLSFDLRNKLHFLGAMLFLIHNDIACRVSELCKIKIEDINLKNGELHYYARKNKVEVAAILSAITIVALKVFLKEVHDNKKSGYLFVKTSTDGSGFSKETVTENYVRNIYKAAGDRAGLDFTLSTHMIRRTFVTRSIELGGDISMIQQLVGHKDIRSTVQYVHLSKKVLRQAHNNFGTLNTLGKKGRDGNE